MRNPLHRHFQNLEMQHQKNVAAVASLNGEDLNSVRLSQINMKTNRSPQLMDNRSIATGSTIPQGDSIAYINAHGRITTPDDYTPNFTNIISSTEISKTETFPGSLPT